MSTTITQSKSSNNLIQVRVPSELKNRVSKLFNELGTSTSDVIRMMLIEADKTKSIPFRVRTDAYPITANERIEEVKATFALEDMPLTNEDIKELQDFELAKTTTEELRRKTLAEIRKRNKK